MKASLRTLSLSLIIVIGMGLGTYSHAQDVAVNPACLKPEAAKPTGKTDPRGPYRRPQRIILLPIHLAWSTS